MINRQKGLTEHLAAFVVNTRYEDLPHECVGLSKRSFLDTLGITLAGTVEPGAEILTQYVRQAGDTPVASVLGQGFKTSARNAALVNGTAAHILGFSDISMIRIVHPSVSIVPAIWAVAEQASASGEDVLLAHVLGVEVACKLGGVLNPGFNIKGWHPCSVLGGFGAAVAAGKLLGLDAGKMANAIGIVAMETSGIKAGMGTMCKSYGTGRAAENGVVAAMLAQLGFTGPVDVLEGRDGFLQTFGDGVSAPGLVESLGNPWDFVWPGMALKAYPSCTCSHTSIDAVLELRRQHDVSPEDIEAITCSVAPSVANYLKFPEPRGPLEAKYSLQFCVAAALIDGAVEVKTFSNEKLQDPRIIDMMRRVTMDVSPELAALGYNPESAPFGARVTMRLRNGREYVCRRDKGPWEPETSPSWDDILPKYRACAETVLGRTEIEETIEVVAGIEKQETITGLMNIVRGSSRTADGRRRDRSPARGRAVVGGQQ